jgi:hypothetical protein
MIKCKRYDYFTLRTCFGNSGRVLARTCFGNKDVIWQQGSVLAIQDVIWQLIRTCFGNSGRDMAIQEVFWQYRMCFGNKDVIWQQGSDMAI